MFGFLNLGNEFEQQRLKLFFLLLQEGHNGNRRRKMEQMMTFSGIKEIFL